MMPPIAAIGTVVIELYGPPPGHARWGIANWGEDVWTTLDWQSVLPQSLNAKASWGSDDASLGILSQAAAGTWTISTYDPDRLLDPANAQSPFQSVLHPGSRVRIRYVGTETRTVKRGIIDEVSYNVRDETGAIRATDGVSQLVAASVPAATGGAPSGLRARARFLLALTGLTDITVEDDPAEGDPTVGVAPTEAATVWDWLSTAALDVLHACWLSPDNIIKFRSFGEPRDLGLTIGGVDGIPIESVGPRSSLRGVYSRVIGFDDGAPSTPIALTNEQTKQWAGIVTFERTRPVPDGTLWVTNVLADRSGAALQFDLGTLRPRTEAELLALLDTEMVDVAHLAITHRDEGREELETPIEAAPRVLGGRIEANTLTGWSIALGTYVTAAEWTDAEVIPPDPPDPEPPATQTVVRTYSVNRDSRAFLSSSGQKLGSGVEHELPVGAWAGGKNRAFLGFATINWSDVVEYVGCELRIFTSDQVNIGFGSSPKVRIKRVTGPWSEGSASSPTTGNALVWPGPSVTSSGERVVDVSDDENDLQILSINNLARAWAPTAAGGSAAKNHGIAIYSYAENTESRTTEFYSREEGAAWDAEIRLTVKIPA